MQSSFSVIKENRAQKGSVKEISTNYEVKIDNKDTKEVISEETGVTYEEAKRYIESYEKIGKSIIEDASRKKDKCIQEAYEKASLIEKEAYEKGYSQGQKNGYDDGKKEALDEAREEADKIINDAENVLLNAKKDYSDYLDSKSEDILNLVIEVARQVLKRDISENIDISKMVEEALKLSKDEENLIIKCNPVYVDELKKNIDIWKPSYNIKESIFVLPVDSMEKGEAIIEKDSGVIKVSIDTGLEKIKNALFN